MSGNDFHMHFVSTLDEARKLAAGQKKYWVSNCGCREAQAEAGQKCKRSRMDTCLHWREGAGSSENGVKVLSHAAVQKLFKLAAERHLVCRPFRAQMPPHRVEGVCFCCDDCCAYFNGDEGSCDPGALVEKTDRDGCTACGACKEVCFFGARKIVGDVLKVNSRKCKGCGVCVDSCTTGSIAMVRR
jgi:electron transport complex protein RnfB